MRLTVSQAVALLALVALAVGPAVAVQADVYSVGLDHGLATNASVEQFETDGVARANLTTLDMTLAVAQSHEAVGIRGPRVDFNKVYACVDYGEDIPRTVRLAVPDAYAEPRPGERPSITTNHTVTLEPTPSGNATRAEIEFSESARVCWSFQKETGIYFDVRRDIDRFLNSTVGVALPSFGGSGQWQRLDRDVWMDSTQTTLNTTGEMTIQYDADPGEQTSWIPVPDCENPATQEVCRIDAANETTGNRTVTLLSMQEDPPPVRYKQGGDAGADASGAIADIMGAFESFADDVGSFFGGGS